MADVSPLAGLLYRAGRVFLLAGQLAHTFTDEYDRQGSGGLKRVDPTAWSRLLPAFEVFCAALLELRDEMQNPPDGFAPVAEVLMEAAHVAKKIRDVMQTDDGRMWQSFLEFRFHFNSIHLKGAEVVRVATKAQQLDDPFAFVDRPPAPEIDTTPTVPQPPAALIAAAERVIPVVLANVPPDHNGAVELEAEQLVKRLQDVKHTLAAAQWAIHESVRAGRLNVGRVEVGLPHVIRSESRGLPERFFGTHASNVPTSPPTATTGFKPVPKGKPAPFDYFKVIATDALWAWWRAVDAAGTDEPASNTPSASEEPATAGPAPNPPAPGTKRSTERGEGRTKLIAALTHHHRYAQGGSLNTEPIGNNELAKAAGVSPSTASTFFNDKFKGHTKYRALCQDAERLVAALKMLNGDFAPHILYGGVPAGEDDRDSE